MIDSFELAINVIVTPLATGLLFLLYREVSLFFPRRKMLQVLRSSLWACAEMVDQANGEFQKKITLSDVAISNLRKAYSVLAKNSYTAGDLMRKKHRIFFNMIASDAEICAEEFQLYYERLVSEGLDMKTSDYTVTNASRKKPQVTEDEMPFEFRILGVLHNLNRLLSKYRSDISYDFAQKASDGKNLRRYWETRIVSLTGAVSCAAIESRGN